MKSTHKITLLLLATGLLSTLPLQAQPGGGGGMRGMRGGVRAEQILSYLAFDEKIVVSDEQLLKLRAALKESYAKQQEMTKTIRAEMEANDGDFDAVREKMMEMREEVGKTTEAMKESVAAVLNKKQNKLLNKHMKKLEERRGRGFGGRGGGRGGRGGGGGDGAAD